MKDHSFNGMEKYETAFLGKEKGHNYQTNLWMKNKLFQNYVNTHNIPPSVVFPRRICSISIIINIVELFISGHPIPIGVYKQTGITTILLFINALTALILSILTHLRYNR